MEGQKLEWDHAQDTLETVHRVGKFNGFICKLGTLRVILGTQNDWATLAGSDLLQGILALGKARILHDHHDDWHLLVDESKGPVLQLSGQDTF